MRTFRVLVTIVILAALMMIACARPTEIRTTKPADSADNGKPAQREQPGAKEYYERGVKAASYKDAIQEYSKALELDPGFADAYLGRGDAYSGLEKAAEAVRDYSKYLELKPKDIFGYYKRAAAYGYAGDYQRCIEDWDIVIAQFPKEASVYYSRGTCYELSGKRERAAEDYKTAAKLGYGPARDELKSRGIQW